MKFLLLILVVVANSFAASPERDARIAFCSKFLLQWEAFDDTSWTDDLLERKRVEALALIRRIAGPVAEAQAREAFAEQQELSVDDIVEFMSGDGVTRFRSSLEEMRAKLQSRSEELTDEEADDGSIFPYQFDKEVDAFAAVGAHNRNEAIDGFLKRHFDNPMTAVPTLQLALKRTALVDLAKIYGRFVSGRPFIAHKQLASQVQLYVEFSVVQAIVRMDGFPTLFHMVSTREWELNNETVLYSGKENTEILRTLLRMVFIYELFYQGSIDAMQKHYKTAFVPWLVDKMSETKDERPYGLRYSIAMVLALMESQARYDAVLGFLSLFEESTLGDGVTIPTDPAKLRTKLELEGKEREHLAKLQQGLHRSPVRRSKPILEGVISGWSEERRSRGQFADKMPPYEKVLDWIIRPSGFEGSEEDEQTMDWLRIDDAIEDYPHVAKQLTERAKRANP